MSNECWKAITLHPLTEIYEILQIEESISVSRQTLRRKGHGRCTFPSRITINRKVQVKLYTNLQYSMKNSSI